MTISAPPGPVSSASASAHQKIAYLISTYPTLSHTFILREIQHLEQLGWDVSIASINNPDRPNSALLPEEQAHAAKTFFIKRAGIPGALLAFIRQMFHHPFCVLKTLFLALRMGEGHFKESLLYMAYFIEAVMLADWMKQRRLHLLHVHFANSAAAVGVLCKQLTGCLYSFTVHGPDELSDVTRQRLRHKFAAADRIICITNYAQSRIMLHANILDWSKVRIVRVGLDPEPFLALAQSRTSKRNNIPQILSIGRLAPAKGQMILLDALAKLKQRHCNAHLTLIGSGPLQPELEAQAKHLGLGPEDLTFAGGQNQVQVKQALAQSDLFVLSSFAEGLPVVLMEALLSGLPCIATYIAGIPELIRDGQDGLLVPASDAEALTNALFTFITNPELAQKTAISGAKRVLDMHDIQQTAVTLSKCFEELHQKINALQ